MNEATQDTELNQDNSNTATTNDNTSWLSSLPDNLKDNETLAGFKDVSTLAQSYLEAQQKLGAGGIPQTNAPAEEWEQYYDKAGRPQDKKYISQRNDGEEEYLKTFEEMFHSSGLSKKQGQMLFEALNKHFDGMEEKLKTQNEQKQKEAFSSNVQTLKDHFGNEYDSKIALADAALTKFGNQALHGYLQQTFDPAMIDCLAKIGATLKPDSLVTGSANIAANDPKSALNEIKRLESDEAFAVKLGDKNHPEHNEAVSRMRELYKTAYDT